MTLKACLKSQSRQPGQGHCKHAKNLLICLSFPLFLLLLLFLVFLVFLVFLGFLVLLVLFVFLVEANNAKECCWELEHLHTRAKWRTRHDMLRDVPMLEIILD